MSSNQYYSPTDRLIDAICENDMFEIKNILEHHKVNVNRAEKIDRTMYFINSEDVRRILMSEISPSDIEAFTPLEVAIICGRVALIHQLLYEYCAMVTTAAIVFADIARSIKSTGTTTTGSVDLVKLLQELQLLDGLLDSFDISRKDQREYRESVECRRGARLGIIRDKQMLDDFLNNSRHEKSEKSSLQARAVRI